MNTRGSVMIRKQIELGPKRRLKNMWEEKRRNKRIDKRRKTKWYRMNKT